MSSAGGGRYIDDADLGDGLDAGDALATGEAGGEERECGEPGGPFDELGLGESHGCAAIILPDDCKRRKAWRLRVTRFAVRWKLLAYLQLPPPPTPLPDKVF